jgi:hypothetical protein
MWWLIILIPLILITLLLFLKVRLCIAYENDISVKLKILLFNIPLFPAKKKKPKPRDFTVKKLRKKQAALEKKSAKKLAKKQAKEQKKAEEAENAPKKDKATQIKEILDLIKLVLENVMSPFGRYLKIEILKMRIVIGTPDPAKTAFLYGTVSQSVSYIIEMLSNITNIDVKKKNSITITPDFFEGRSEAEINLTLGLRVWHALSLAVKFFMAYIKHSRTKAAETVQLDTEAAKNTADTDNTNETNDTNNIKINSEE